MGRLNNISGKDAVRAFQKAGWQKIGQVGSHVIMIKFLARRGIDEDEMVLMTGRGKTVIRQYMRLLRRHHPEIVNGE